ncbi:MAG: hypothetical protein HY606_03240, partial [Planctomycetes bacterium]|nr:hypothetical protein [Planctomycetota bacterium]
MKYWFRFRYNILVIRVIGASSRLWSILNKVSEIKKISLFVFISAVLCIGSVALRKTGWDGRSEFHTVIEVVSTMLASIAGIMALTRFYSKKNSIYLFIGSGFLGAALLDGYHA